MNTDKKTHKETSLRYFPGSKSGLLVSIDVPRLRFNVYTIARHRLIFKGVLPSRKGPRRRRCESSKKPVAT